MNEISCPFCHSAPALQTGAAPFYFCPVCGLRTPAMNQEGLPKSQRERLTGVMWDTLAAGLLERMVRLQVSYPEMYKNITGKPADEHGIAWAYGKINSGYAIRRRRWPDEWHLLKAHDNDYRLVKEHVADMLLTKDWGDAKYSWLPTRDDAEATDWELFTGAKEGVDY